MHGDRSAFAMLVRRHDPSVRALVAGMLRGGSSVEDVLQDAYVKAFRSLGSYKLDRSFKAWLHRIAYTTAIDEIRRRKRTLFVDVSDEPISSGAPRVDDEVVRRMELREALQRLTERQRAVILLVDGQGFDYREAGAALDIASGLVGFHLHKARRILREELLGQQEGAAAAAAAA